jgi:hypothetical protein
MNTPPFNKVFRSRISVLLVLFILGAFIAPVVSTVQDRVHPAAIVILIGTFAMAMLLLVSMRYTISGSKLTWFGGQTDIADIRSVKRSYNPLSSPASSLKRLRIVINGRGGTNDTWLLISPVREREFIDALKAVNPDIEVDIQDKKGIWRIWDWDI